MRVAVDVRAGVLEQATLAEVADDLIGCVAGRDAVEPAVLGEEVAGLVDRHQHLQPVLLAQVEVLGACARRDVDDAGAVVERDVVPRNHTVRDVRDRGQMVERPLVLEPDEIGAAHALHEMVLGITRDGDPLAVVALAVLGLRVHSGGNIGRQRPGCRRPDDERLALAPLEREAHEERRVRSLLVHVGLRELVLRDGRPAPRAPLGRAVSLVERAALLKRLQEPPDVLDVRVAEREVVVAPVHPLAQADRLLRDHARGLGDEVTALACELGEAVLLDLVLRVQAEVALDLDLDPEPLTVEAVLVALVEPAQRFVALEDVLVGPAPQVMDAQAVDGVRRLRAVDEAEALPASVLLPQPVEDPLRLPPGENVPLESRMIRDSR